MNGAEVAELGRGGIKAVAVATGAHPDTVAKGAREPDSGADPGGATLRTAVSVPPSPGALTISTDVAN